MWPKLCLFICFCCWCNFAPTAANFYKSNLTDLNQCKVYYSRSGSIYKDFFEIGDEAPLNGSLLDFHFLVMSPSDAHILLAPSSAIQSGDPVYEIVIGAGGNTFCDIRRMQKSAVKATVRIKGLLSSLDAQPFWIHIGKDGVIDVGKEGEELPFITWTDPDPLPLKVFSFSTWPGVEAKWFFDCPRGNETSKSRELQRPMTALEKLRRDLLFYYDPYVRPVKNTSDITVVGLTISTDLVTLDEHSSILSLSGKMRMNWMDHKLRWNASTYEGIDTMHIFRREIWVPNMFLFNSAEASTDILQDSMMVVNSSGFVTWMAAVQLRSWCSPEDLGRWPRDEHYCEVVLGFFRDFDHLQLMFSVNESNFSCPYTSAWKILEVESFLNVGWKNSSFENGSSFFDPPGLSLQFKLRRTSTAYTIIWLTPFFVVAISLLISFWVSPFGSMKISLACLQLVVTSVTLIGLGMTIPIHSRLVPNLVLLYSFSLVGSLMAVIISIIVINLSRNPQKYALPHVLTKLLLSFFTKSFLCLPEMKSCEKYGNLNESLPKLNENQQNLWILLGVAIDRIAFLVYFVLISYALAYVTY